MNVSFGNPENAVATEVVVEQVPTPVEGVTVESITGHTPAQPATPAEVKRIEADPAPGLPAVRQPSSLAPAGLVLGDKLPNFNDIILPRINIVQGIGQLKDSFDVGELVFNQNTVLFSPPIINAKTGAVEKQASPPVVLAVLGFRPTRFVEKVEGGARGLIVNTEDEVRAAGGTLDYNEWKLKKASGMKRFEQLAEALVAVRRPERCADDDTVFTYQVGPHKYALSLWGMKGVVYTAAAKKVFFTQRGIGCLRKEGYPSYHFNVTTRLETYPGGNQAWIPVCLPGEKSGEDFMAFARDILGA